MIYLSKNPNPLGGTYWYKYKKTGDITDTSEFFKQAFGDIKEKDPKIVKQIIMQRSNRFDEWQEIQRVAMVYNRLVIFRADRFHANTVLFGDDKETGRLTQHFVFYSHQQ